MLGAASSLFASRGYEATRIEEISQEAGVSPATIYNYFSTKANILTALAVQHARSSLPARRAFVRDPPADPLVAVQAFERLLADQALNTLGRDCWRVIFAAPYTQPNSPLHRAGIFFSSLILRHYVIMLQGFQRRGLIGDGVNIHVLADLFTALGTHHFGRFIASETMSLDDLKAGVAEQVGQVLSGALRKRKPGRSVVEARRDHASPRA